MDKFTLKADKLFMESYIAQKYPSCTHDLDLDMTFDDIGRACTQFLKEKNKVIPPVELCEEEINEIEKYIRTNNDEKGQDTFIFYLMTKTATLVLKRHYNDDGSRKY